MEQALLLTVPDATRLLSKRVREARERAGWTQAELAARASVGVATVSRLERHGTGQMVSFLRILTALGHLHDVEAVLRQPEPRTIDELRRR